MRIGLALALALVAAPLSAQDREVARQHFEAGTEAFETGNYELAVTEFQAAYEIAPHPDILFNIYSAAERAGQLEVAARALEQHLAAAQIEPDRRPALEERLARLRERIARTAQEAPPREEAPREEAPREEAPQERPAPPPPPSGGVHPAAIAVTVAGGVLLASFAVFAGLSEMEDRNLASTCSPVCSDQEVAAMIAYSYVADASWIAGAAFGIAGIVLLIVLPPEQSAPIQAAPLVGPDVAGVLVGGRW